MIDILVPTLGRPAALVPLLENLRERTPQGEFCLWFVLDQGDAESKREVFALPSADDFRMVLNDGTYPIKSNAGFAAAARAASTRSQGSLVLPTADDVIFHEGWLEAAAAAFEDPDVMVVGCDDLSPATEDRSHATMPILRHSYVEDPGAAFGEPGAVFHEGYSHNFCETELWQLARQRGVSAWADGCVIEHCHPAWGKREVDETDRKGNMSGWDEDEALFRARQREWLAA